MRHLIKLALLTFVVAFAAGAVEAQRVDRNIRYAPSGMRLDLCRPAADKVRKTIVILIHGGGFTDGDRSDMLGLCETLSQGGFLSATISYRLARSGKGYPAPVDDVKSAIEWARANAARYGADQGHVVVMGYSAGGTLALSAGLSTNSGVAAIIDVAGISDFGQALRETQHQRLRDDINAYLRGTPAEAASPIRLVSRDDPPVLVFHGKADSLVPVAQSVRLAEELNRANVKMLLRVFDGGGHDILTADSPHLEQLLQEMTDFLLAVDAS